MSEIIECVLIHRISKSEIDLGSVKLQWKNFILTSNLDRNGCKSVIARFD